MTKEELLQKFNLKLPVVASPMFIVSQPELVKACCKNGIIGTFPALNQRSSEGFEEWLVELNKDFQAWEKETGEKAPPYGVNLIVHRTNPRVQADLEICVKHKVPIIITSLGAVQELVDAVHSYGGLVFHDVTNIRHAQKAIAAGVDGLILVTAGAGGHAGTLNPIPFISEIREIWDGLILLGGNISTGRDIASVLQMGADIAYMGTRFINTTEASAPEAYKQMIIDSGTKDIVYTAAISGVPANFMKQSLVAAGIPEEFWKASAKVDFGEELNSEAKAWKTIWSAGQGVATIKDVLPTEELISRLKKEFIEAIQQQYKQLESYG
ncbi:MAG: nitronate monooxygenase family protein [Bacteroidia bacterium]|nr:nitronate monooxygenase family protein [Bacteroidia bacterium]